MDWHIKWTLLVSIQLKDSASEHVNETFDGDL